MPMSAFALCVILHLQGTGNAKEFVLGAGGPCIATIDMRTEAGEPVPAWACAVANLSSTEPGYMAATGPTSCTVVVHGKLGDRILVLGHPYSKP